MLNKPTIVSSEMTPREQQLTIIDMLESSAAVDPIELINAYRKLADLFDTGKDQNKAAAKEARMNVLVLQKSGPIERQLFIIDKLEEVEDPDLEALSEAYVTLADLFMQVGKMEEAATSQHNSQQLRALFVESGRGKRPQSRLNTARSENSDRGTAAGSGIDTPGRADANMSTSAMAAAAMLEYTDRAEGGFSADSFDVAGKGRPLSASGYRSSRPTSGAGARPSSGRSVRIAETEVKTEQSRAESKQQDNNNKNSSPIVQGVRASSPPRIIRHDSKTSTIVQHRPLSRGSGRDSPSPAADSKDDAGFDGEVKGGGGGGEGSISQFNAESKTGESVSVDFKADSKSGEGHGDGDGDGGHALPSKGAFPRFSDMSTSIGDHAMDQDGHKDDGGEADVVEVKAEAKTEAEVDYPLDDQNYEEDDDFLLTALEADAKYEKEETEKKVDKDDDKCGIDTSMSVVLGNSQSIVGAQSLTQSQTKSRSPVMFLTWDGDPDSFQNVDKLKRFLRAKGYIVFEHAGGDCTGSASPIDGFDARKLFASSSTDSIDGTQVNANNSVADGSSLAESQATQSMGASARAKVSQVLVDQMTISTVFVACVTRKFTKNMNCKKLVLRMRELQIEMGAKKSAEMLYCMIHGDFTTESQPYHCRDGWLGYLLRDSLWSPAWSHAHTAGAAEAIASTVNLRRSVIRLNPLHVLYIESRGQKGVCPPSQIG